MARNHARILTAIWDDPEFCRLTPGAQRMFMALLTQAKITMVGSLDYVPKRWATQAAGLTVADVETAVTELEDARFVLVDRDVDELVIRTFVEHDGAARSGTQRAAMWSAWTALASPVLARMVLDEIPPYAWEAANDKGLGAPPAEAVALRDTPPATTPDTPGDTPSDTASDTPSDAVGDTHRRYQSLKPDPVTGNRPGSADADPSAPDGAAPADDQSIKSDPTLVDDLCAQLADRIETHRDGDRPKVTQAWRRDMDLLLRRGPTDVEPAAPVSPEKLRASIDAVFARLATRDGSGFCWADQVRSPAALRRHWTQLRQAERAQRAAAGPSRNDIAERARQRQAGRRPDPSPLREALGGNR